LPRPDVTLDEVMPFEPSAIGQGKAIRRFALDQQGALMRLANMLYALRVAKPTIGHHHGRRQDQATPTQHCSALVEHQLGLAHFVPTWRPRPYGIRPSHGKVHRDNQTTIANNY
jgi:hypothetical protein